MIKHVCYHHTNRSLKKKQELGVYLKERLRIVRVIKSRQRENVGYVQDLQHDNESYHQKINLTKPNQYLQEIKNHPLMRRKMNHF
jgi:hypothetical protein